MLCTTRGSLSLPGVVHSIAAWRWVDVLPSSMHLTK
jgi:hypothetical protein